MSDKQQINLEDYMKLYPDSFDHIPVWNDKFALMRQWKQPRTYRKYKRLLKIKWLIYSVYQNIRHILGMPCKRLYLCSFGCGNGWKPLIDRVMKVVNEEEGIYIHQVKEKFGQLRIYLSSYTDDLNKLIRDVENESATICESCGTKDNVKCSSGGGYWILTLCNKCRGESQIKNI